MIVRDNSETQGAGSLTNYMTKNGHELKGSHGQEMTDEEVERFHDRSEEEGFTRHLILNPERNDLSEEQLDRAARESLNEWYEQEDMQDMEFAYSVHNEPENSHVHVAATASQDSGDLWVNSQQQEDKIDRLQDDIAADRFSDHSLEQQQQQMLEQDRDDELLQERAEVASNHETELRDVIADEVYDDLDLDNDLDHDRDQGSDPSADHDAPAPELSALGAAVRAANTSVPNMSPYAAMIEKGMEKSAERQREQEQRDREQRDRDRSRRR